jgi:hypothetical protein
MIEAWVRGWLGIGGLVSGWWLINHLYHASRPAGESRSGCPGEFGCSGAGGCGVARNLPAGRPTETKPRGGQSGVPIARERERHSRDCQAEEGVR